MKVERSDRGRRLKSARTLVSKFVYVGLVWGLPLAFFLVMADVLMATLGVLGAGGWVACAMGLVVWLILAGEFVWKLLFSADRAAEGTAKSVGAEVTPFDRWGLPALEVSVGIPAGVRITGTSWTGGDRVLLGRPKFDETVRLEGPGDLFLAALDGGVRPTLRDLVALFDCVAEEGVAIVALPPRVSPDVVEAVLRDLLGLRQALLLPSEQIADRLAAMVRDPESPVRGPALEALLQHHPESPHALVVSYELFSSDQLNLALRAAELLGKEEVRVEILEKMEAIEGSLSLSADGEAGHLSYELGAGAGALSRGEPNSD